jgi:hypothetical protein
MVKILSRYCPGIGPKALKKTAKTSDRIVGILADIQIEDFLKKKLRALPLN